MNQKNIEPPAIFSESDINEMTERARTTKKAIRASRRSQKATAHRLGLTLVQSVHPFHTRPQHADIPAPKPIQSET